MIVFGIRWVRVAIVAGLWLLGAGSALAVVPQVQITIAAWSPYFQPATVVSYTKSVIRWENPTASHHTVTHDGCFSEGLCLFDSGALAPNEYFTVRGLPAGRYPYHCRIHPIMRGVLMVTKPEAARTGSLGDAPKPIIERERPGHPGAAHPNSPTLPKL